MPGYGTPTSPPAVWRVSVPRPWLSLLILALLVRAVMIGLTLAAYGIGPDPLTALGAAWDQWDAKHYLYLAANGYSHSGDARNLIAFFPLYPLLVHIATSISGELQVTAVVVSNLSFLLALLLLYRFARQRGFDACAANRATLP